MSTAILSRKVLNEFREYLVSTSTVSRIRMEFEAAGVPCQTDYAPDVQGDRRTLIEQFYKGSDLTRVTDVRKLLVVFENILSELQHQMTSEYADDVKESAKRSFNNLFGWLRKEGFTFQNGVLASDRLNEEPSFDFRNLESLLTTVARLCAQECRGFSWLVLRLRVPELRMPSGRQRGWRMDGVS